MAESAPKKPAGNKNVNNVSNAVRSVLFTFFLICIGAFLIANMNGKQTFIAEK